MNFLRAFVFRFFIGILVAGTLGVPFAQGDVTRPAAIEPKGTAVRKLQRGFLNVVLSPIEIADQLHDKKHLPGFFPGWVIGLCEGLFFAAGRAVTGVYEIATFPLPVPSNYEPIVFPEFAWEHFE